MTSDCMPCDRAKPERRKHRLPMEAGVHQACCRLPPSTNNRSATRPDPLHPVHRHDVGRTRAPDRTALDDRRYRNESGARACALRARRSTAATPGSSCLGSPRRQGRAADRGGAPARVRNLHRAELRPRAHNPRGLAVRARARNDISGRLLPAISCAHSRKSTSTAATKALHGIEPEVNDQRRREAVAQHVEAHAIESGRIARAEIVGTGSRAIAGVCTGSARDRRWTQLAEL